MSKNPTKLNDTTKTKKIRCIKRLKIILQEQHFTIVFDVNCRSLYIYGKLKNVKIYVMQIICKNIKNEVIIYMKLLQCSMFQVNCYLLSISLIMLVKI